MVIVICGPIASGKSTIGRAVARLFELQGTDAAAIDLDLVYEMFQRDGGSKTSVPTWRRARRTVAGLTDVLLRDGVSVIVVEGDFLAAEERAEYVTALRSPIVPLFVTTKVSIDIALERVQRDPTRGISRDPDFLRRHYEQLQGEIRIRPATDLVLDTSSVGVEEAARTIAEWASARASIT
jgi:shikimate kinase